MPVKVIDNIYVNELKNGRKNYYLRAVHPRTHERITIQFSVPSSINTEKKLKHYLEEKRRELLDELEMSSCIRNRKMSFDSYYYEIFIPKKRRQGLAPKTINDYDKFYQRHAKEHIGKIAIGDLNRMDIIDLCDKMERKGVGNATIRYVYRIIRAAMNSAIEDEIIEKNPAIGKLVCPKEKKKEKRTLTMEELAYVIACSDREPLFWRIMTHLLVRTGCRRGELLGVRWEDVDFLKRKISIKHSVSYVPGQPVFLKETKTESSEREIPISDEDLALLQMFKEEKEHGFVFHGDLGDETMMHPDAVTRYYRRFCDKYDIETFSPHSLRRSLTTQMIVGMGVDPKTVQLILGHSSLTTTLSYYTIPNTEQLREQMERFSEKIQSTSADTE